MNLLDTLTSPVLFRGDATTAYRDPAAVYHNGVIHLFFTLVKTEADGQVYLYMASSQSRDLKNWSPAKFMTPRNQALNYSSPGNIVRLNNQWIMCLQTYPRQNGEKYANNTARVFIMRSEDLENWSVPELLRVKGDEVPNDQMGRMIDPYVLQDKDDARRWWCFYKQNGVSMSQSEDLTHWHYVGHAEAGENVCVLVDRGEYVLFHSPENGIGVKRSADLRHWKNEPLITLGQKDWPWAQGRLTAGFVIDLRHVPGISQYVMFFHGTGPQDESVIFDTHACIGIAWSDDLKSWHWPK